MDAAKTPAHLFTILVFFYNLFDTAIAPYSIYTDCWHWD